MTSAIENAFKEALKKRLIGAQEVVSTISIDEKIHLDATNGEGIQNNSSAMIDFKSTTSTNDHHKLSVTKKSSFDVIYDQIGNLISQGKHFAARDLHKSNKGLITEAEFNRITRDVYGKRWVSKASVTG